ncbi:hypothetical protein CDAR_312121 [Caerostris darwini]|uniref:Uncharacterized protein n=1 Tax=Caerostris darwini TaxID=1538125 RepID=A0AAV4S5T4_9ARAC|nr:hypothetical protein CDAR_312121 [Caerostris darwini]
MTIGRFVESFFAEKVTLLYHFRGAFCRGTGVFRGSSIRLSTSRSHIVPAPYEKSRHCYSATLREMYFPTLHGNVGYLRNFLSFLLPLKNLANNIVTFPSQVRSIVLFFQSGFILWFIQKNRTFSAV